MIYSQIFLTAPAREISGAPTKLWSAGDTGVDFRIPAVGDGGGFFFVLVLGFFLEVETTGLGAAAAEDLEA